MEDNKKSNSDKYIKIKGFQQYKENPFIPNLLVPRGKKNIVVSRQSDKALISTITGEIDDDTLFIGQTKELDKEQFVKIFHSQLQAIFDLSKSALKIFSYIASVTAFNDRILFDLEECKKFTGYRGSEAIYKGIGELIKAEIIARTVHHNIFFINPQIFYKGDRIVLVQDYRLKRKKQVHENPNQLSLLNTWSNEK
jgi:hypothetical protein